MVVPSFIDFYCKTPIYHSHTIYSRNRFILTRGFSYYIGVGAAAIFYQNPQTFGACVFSILFVYNLGISKEGFFLSIICSFHSYLIQYLEALKTYPCILKNFFARCARSPPIHMMRYCFAGLHLFMLAETHSHKGFPLSITINYLVIYKAGQKIFLWAE